ncbi:hypothetical protein [Streptomyces sp. NPDC047042]|uniref:hypothetical protein n=1 Tax=Streptomyces sp. NPDC047042 TaxID=3154807 RepID=UPI0034049E44
MQTAFAPLLQQLVSVYNLSSGLMDELLRSADSPLATTDEGRAYLVQLATALEHSNRAAAHLSTAVTGLADAHRLTARPGTATPVESQLNITLGHDDALRSLQRALVAVTAHSQTLNPPRRLPRCRRSASSTAGPPSPPAPTAYAADPDAHALATAARTTLENLWTPVLHRPSHRHRVCRRLTSAGADSPASSSLCSRRPLRSVALVDGPTVTARNGTGCWTYSAPFSGPQTLTPLPCGNGPKAPVVEEATATYTVVRGWSLTGSRAPDGVPVHLTAAPELDGGFTDSSSCGGV